MKQIWILIVVAIIILLALASGTAYFFLDFKGDSESVDAISKRPRRFNVFDGFSLCEQAIRDSVSGKLISLESDDRAAKYDYRDNMNLLFFNAVYRPGVGLWGGGHGAETGAFIRCDVSAETNQVEAVRIRPGEEEDFTEVHRKP